MKKFKDRKDGKYIKPEDSIHAIMPYLYNKRTESEVYAKVTFDVTKLKEYVDNKKKDYPITYFHAFTTAMAKTIYNRPLLNRFIAGRRIYERNKVSMAFVAKNKFEDNAEERLIVLDIEEDMTLEKISKKIYDIVTKTRNDGTNSMNDTLKFITKLPRWLLKPIVGFVKWLDYHGWVPNFLKEGDLNYATVLLSNLGSIGFSSCYHHLNNYGTNSIVATIGVIKPVYEMDKEGNIIEKQVVDISFTLDERIADGFYFAKSIQLFEEYLNNPKILDEKIKF